MIPFTAIIRIENKQGRGLRYWIIPLFLVWLLLLPIALLLLPLFFVVCLVGRVNPFQALATFWRIFIALKGTHVEVEDSRRSVLVSIP